MLGSLALLSQVQASTPNIDVMDWTPMNQENLVNLESDLIEAEQSEHSSPIVGGHRKRRRYYDSYDYWWDYWTYWDDYDDDEDDDEDEEFESEYFWDGFSSPGSGERITAFTFGLLLGGALESSAIVGNIYPCLG